MQKIIYIAFIFFASYVGIAQTPVDSTVTESFQPQYRYGINYRLKMRSGAVYTGFLKEETKEFVTLENRATRQTVELRKSEIVNVANRGGDLADDLMGENPHSKNYLFSSSAFLFNEGKASTNSHWLLLENIDYAFTDNFAISLNTLAFYPFTLGAKCAFQLSDNNYIGANVFVVGDITSGNDGNFLFGYGAMGKFTKGSSNKNITLSGGVLGLNSDLFYLSPRGPFVNLGFVSAAYCNRFCNKVALNLEGWYMPEINIGLGGIGFKFVGDDVTCWTLGCYTLMNSYDNSLKLNLKTIPIPYFGVSKNFN